MVFRGWPVDAVVVDECGDQLRQRGIHYRIEDDVPVQLREGVRSHEELLSGRSFDVFVERIGIEHAGE